MSAVPASPGPFPSEQGVLQAVLHRRLEALPSLRVDLFGTRSQGRTEPRSAFDLLTVFDDRTPDVDDADPNAPLLGLGVRPVPGQRSELRNALADPTKVLSHRPRTVSGAPAASSGRAARQRLARGAWLRHQTFCAHRLAYCTSRDRGKSRVVSNMGRCPKILCVNDVTHKLPGLPSRRAMSYASDAFDRRTRPPLDPKVVKTGGLRLNPGLSSGCYPADADAESEVRWLAKQVTQEHWRAPQSAHTTVLRAHSSWRSVFLWTRHERKSE